MTQHDDNPAPTAAATSWRLTRAGAWILSNAQGAEIGHAYEVAAGRWCGDPWGREVRYFESGDAGTAAAKAYVMRALGYSAPVQKAAPLPFTVVGYSTRQWGPIYRHVMAASAQAARDMIEGDAAGVWHDGAQVVAVFAGHLVAEVTDFNVDAEA